MRLARVAWLVTVPAAGLALVLLGGMLAPAAGATAAATHRSAHRPTHRATHRTAHRAAPAADPPSLSVSASVTPSPLTIGAPATYSVTVTNGGTAAATGVVSTLNFSVNGSTTGLTFGSLPSACAVTNPASLIVTCTETTALAAGGSVTYQIPVTPDPGLSSGVNIVLQASSFANGVPAASTQLVSQAYVLTDVSITKTGPVTVSAGGTINYTITVTNAGPSNAVQVYWHDPTDGNLTSFVSISPSASCDTGGLTITCSQQTMTPGQSQTYQMQLQARPGLANGTQIPNCVTVYTGTTESNYNNNTSCMTTTVGTAPPPPTSTVTVSKSAAQGTVEVGGTIDYSVTVTNTGPDPAANVTVRDPLNAPFVGVSTLPSDCSLVDTTVTCTAATLGLNQSRTYSYSVTLDPSVAAGTIVSNCASVTSTVNVIVPQPNPSCVQTTVVPVPMAHLVMTKTASATSVGPGNTFSYTLTAANNGPDDAQNAAVSDFIDPSVATIVSVPSGCSASAGTVTCAVGTLAANTTQSFTITVQANGGDPAGTDIRNCGKVSSTTANPEPNDQTDCVDTYVDPPVPVANIEVTKTGPATASAGDTISYTLTAANTGPDTVTNVVVKDPLNAAQVTAGPLPAGCTLNQSTVICDAGTIAPGNAASFTITVTVNSSLPLGTQIDNCGQATSVSTLVIQTGDSACLTTVVVPPASADVSVTKAGPPSVAPGGTISYTIAVANNGPDAAGNVTVTDVLDPSLVTPVPPLPAGCTLTAATVTCQAGTLTAAGAGSTATFPIDVRVNPGIQGVVIPNCAQAATTTTDTDLSNNLSCVSTTVSNGATIAPSAVIDVVKRGPATANADGTISFTLDATNTGPDAVSSAVITDPVDLPLVNVVSVSNGCVFDGVTLSCLTGGLAVGQVKSFTYTLRVRAGATVGAQITNCATAGSEVFLGRGLALNCAQTLIGPASLAHLVITKTAPRRVKPGGTITYNFTLANTGPDAAQDIVVQDPVHDPTLITITSMPPECRLAGQTVTCTLASLPAGVTLHFKATIRVRDNVPDDTVLGNCVSVYSPTQDRDPNLTNIQSCVSTIVSMQAATKPPGTKPPGTKPPGKKPPGKKHPSRPFIPVTG